MYLKNTSMYEWTGTSGSETESKLPNTRINNRTKFQVASFADLSTGTATQSEERWYAMKYLEKLAHTKIKSARITKLHGTLPDGHIINAGYSGSYATPKASGSASTIATSQIPSNLITTSPLTIETFDATDAEYQFLVLQHDIGADVAAWDPTKQVGDSAYALIEIAYILQQFDASGMVIPGGNDIVDTFDNTQIAIYAVLDQGNGDEMQLFGCTENAVTAGFGVEWVELTKGPLQGTESRSLNQRTQNLSGNIKSMNPWNWLKFLHGVDLGDDEWYGQIQFNSDWKPVESIPIILDTFSTGGRRLTIEAPDAALRINGDINLGQDGAMMPFEINLGETVNLYYSLDIMDVHRFKVKIKLT